MIEAGKWYRHRETGRRFEVLGVKEDTVLLKSPTHGYVTTERGDFCKWFEKSTPPGELGRKRRF